MRFIILAVLSYVMIVPVSGQLSKTIKKAKKEVNKASKVLGSGDLSADEIGAGLKEALLKGAQNGSDKAAAVDGFFKNPEIKIPFPKDAKKVATSLKKIGMQDEVRKFVKTLNRSAEMAAGEAKPIFVDAIKEMSIKDAVGILNGEDQQGATNYLKSSSSEKLTKKISPIITKALQATDATKYYKELITAYNNLPMVQKKNADLGEYATQKTLDGLFFLVGEEEKQIRNNPAARTSDLLKKVFN